MPNDHYLKELQACCLAYPEATQEHTFETETFRVRSKIFAMHSVRDDRGSVWVKGRPGDQEMLIGAAPDRFYKPPYLGPNGWIGIWFDEDADWEEINDLIETSYRLIAPKKLAALLDQPAG
jgi:predicted DNA-binding protein (MmcQ/YjbR family)